MLSLIFRGFLIAVGFVASWFAAKDAPAVWRYANGRGANSCSSYRGDIGVLARTVESHFDPRS